MKLVFVGEWWEGSCARSLGEALKVAGASVTEIREDAWFPHWTSLALRAALHVLAPSIRSEFTQRVATVARTERPDWVVFYKGTHATRTLLATLKRDGVRSVNVYPDCSPLNQGRTLREALGEYDLVVSAKVWHPDAWSPLFGYSNECRFLPHAYNELLHWRPFSPRRDTRVDVAMVATYRREYGELMSELAAMPFMRRLRVHIGGFGWRDHFSPPNDWALVGPLHGRAYTDVLSSARLCLAPLTTKVEIDGKRYPGDVDSSRTYELPAMAACSIHRRSEYVRSIFDERSEMPMFEDAQELADQIGSLVTRPALCDDLRVAAQARAVPRDSYRMRARALLSMLAGCAQSQQR